jgi:hypothetical protein
VVLGLDIKGHLQHDRNDACAYLTGAVFALFETREEKKCAKKDMAKPWP